MTKGSTLRLRRRVRRLPPHRNLEAVTAQHRAQCFNHLVMPELHCYPSKLRLVQGVRSSWKQLQMCCFQGLLCVLAACDADRFSQRRRMIVQESNVHEYPRTRWLAPTAAINSDTLQTEAQRTTEPMIWMQIEKEKKRLRHGWQHMTTMDKYLISHRCIVTMDLKLLCTVQHGY